jgi:hypothetical protein
VDSLDGPTDAEIYARLGITPGRPLTMEERIEYHTVRAMPELETFDPTTLED